MSNRPPTGLIPTPELMTAMAAVDRQHAEDYLCKAVDRLNRSSVSTEVYERARGEVVWADFALREACGE